MLIKKMKIGYCPVCKKRTVFLSFDIWLRESYKCVICRSKPRQRAIIKVLSDMVPDWRNKKIYESSPDWGKGRRFALKNCHNYIYSYFYEDKALGESLSDSCTNQNLEKLTYADESFDLVITQDVFEHINNPFKAFEEISRVLKPGGGIFLRYLLMLHYRRQLPGLH